MDIKFKDYTISKPIYLDGREPDKWSFTVLKKTKDGRSNFVIADFHYDFDEPCWRFSSCGTRYLTCYTEGLNEWLLQVMELFYLQLKAEMADSEDYG